MKSEQVNIQVATIKYRIPPPYKTLNPAHIDITEQALNGATLKNIKTKKYGDVSRARISMIVLRTLFTVAPDLYKAALAKKTRQGQKVLDICREAPGPFISALNEQKKKLLNTQTNKKPAL